VAKVTILGERLDDRAVGSIARRLAMRTQPEEVRMRALVRLCASVACAAGLLAWPAAALADHDTRPSFELRALGHSPNPASFLPQSPEVPQGDPAGPLPAEINSDLAFWGDYAFHGNYDGFRIVDISDRQNPVEISHTRCQGNQGDIVVWGNILVRSWNSPAPTPRASMCSISATRQTRRC
jgi:hypothetical protein